MDSVQEILRKIGSNHTTCCYFQYNTLIKFEEDEEPEEITYVGIYTFKGKIYCICDLGDICFDSFDEQDQLLIATRIIAGDYKLTDALQ